DNLSKVIAVIAIGSATKDDIPSAIFRNIVKGEDASIKIVVQPPSSDDVCAFYHLPSKFHRGKVVIFKVIIFSELLVIALACCIVEGTIHFPVVSQRAGIDKLVMILPIVVRFIFIGVGVVRSVRRQK